MDDSEIVDENFKTSSAITSSTPIAPNKVFNFASDESTKSGSDHVDDFILESKLYLPGCSKNSTFINDSDSDSSFSSIKIGEGNNTEIDDLSDGKVEEFLQEDDVLEDDTSDPVYQNQNTKDFMMEEESQVDIEGMFDENADFVNTSIEELGNDPEEVAIDQVIQDQDIQDFMEEEETQMKSEDIFYENNKPEQYSKFYSSDGFVNVSDELEHNPKEGAIDQIIQYQNIHDHMEGEVTQIKTEDMYQDNTEPKQQHLCSNDDCDNSNSIFNTSNKEENAGNADETAMRDCHKPSCTDESLDNTEDFHNDSSTNEYSEPPAASTQKSSSSISTWCGSTSHGNQRHQNPFSGWDRESSLAHEFQKDIHQDSPPSSYATGESIQDKLTEAKNNDDSVDTMDNIHGSPLSEVMSSDIARGIYLKALKDKVDSLSVTYNNLKFEMPQRSLVEDFNSSSKLDSLKNIETISESFKGQKGNKNSELISDSKCKPFIIHVQKVTEQNFEQFEPNELKKEAEEESDRCQHSNDSGDKTFGILEKARIHLQSVNISSDSIPSIEYKNVSCQCLDYQSEDAENEAKENFGKTLSPRQENKCSKVSAEGSILFKPMAGSDSQEKDDDLNSGLTYYCPQCNVTFIKVSETSEAAFEVEMDNDMPSISKTEDNVATESQISRQSQILLDLFSVDNVLSKNILLALTGPHCTTGITATELLKFLKQKSHFKKNAKLKQDMEAFLNNAVSANILEMKGRRYFLTEIADECFEREKSTKVKGKDKAAASKPASIKAKSEKPSEKVVIRSRERNESFEQTDTEMNEPNLLKESRDLLYGKRKRKRSSETVFKELRSRKVIKYA